MHAATLNDHTNEYQDGTIHRVGHDAQPIITIDVDRLVETRALVEANSGAGKSYTLRRFLEQTHGLVQHVVLDPEGEFHTLREKFDYVLAAPKGGDCVANTGTAQLLARRLLELGASAIIDISELGAQQALFVKLFLESLMSAPRELWHPVLVVVDEAHKFCPEKSDAISAAAVIDLMTRGRKRGFAGMLATQRLSKLDKDAAAEANNLIIGRTALDLDIARAATILGMTLKDARAILPKMAPGEFYVVGPALSNTVERIKIGSVQTSHPKAGTRGAAPTPPRDKVRRILAKLADLPAEAEEEVKTTEQLRAKIRELVDERDQLSRAVNAGQPDPQALRDLERENKGLKDFANDTYDTMAKLIAQHQEATRHLKLYEEIGDQMVNEIDVVIDRLTELRNLPVNRLEEWVEANPKDVTMLVPRPDWSQLDKAERAFAISRGMVDDPIEKIRAAHYAWHEKAPTNGTPVGNEGGLPAMHRAFLTVLAQHADRVTQRTGIDGATTARIALPKSKVLIYANYARSGNTNKTFADLTRRSFITARGEDRGSISITKEGRDALGAYEEMPRGWRLREKIMTELRDMERKFFDAACGAYPNVITKADILSQTGYKRSGNTNKAFARLVARDYLVTRGPGVLRVAEELFDG